MLAAHNMRTIHIIGNSHGHLRHRRTKIISVVLIYVRDMLWNPDDKVQLFLHRPWDSTGRCWAPAPRLGWSDALSPVRVRQSLAVCWTAPRRSWPRPTVPIRATCYNTGTVQVMRTFINLFIYWIYQSTAWKSKNSKHQINVFWAIVLSWSRWHLLISAHCSVFLFKKRSEKNVKK